MLRVLFFVVGLSFAAVGQGEDLPTLLGLGEPAVAETETGDPSFAKVLEQWDDQTGVGAMGAIMEWQRVAHTGIGVEAARALLNIAVLAQAEGQNAVAEVALGQFLTRFEDHQLMPQALYILSQVVDEAKRLDVVRFATAMAPASDWTKETQYHYFWQQAWDYGVFSENDSIDERLPQLARRLGEVQMVEGDVRMVLGWVPGALLILYGQAVWGWLLVVGSLLVVWNIGYSWRQMHVPMCVLLLFGLGVLVWQARSYTLAIVVDAEDAQRHAAMMSWTGLLPQPVVFE